MKISFGLVLVSGWMLSAAACGSASNGGAGGSGAPAGSGSGGDGAGGQAGGPAQGTDTITYTTADGTSHPFTGKAFARIENSASDADLMIRIYSEGADGCGYPKLGLSKPWVELEVIRYATNAAAIAPGTYSFALVDENPGNVRGMGYVRHFETGCNVQALVRNSSDGLPGSITITSVSATEVVGTFDFDGKGRPSGQGHASGSFRATVCDVSIGTMCQP